MPRSFNKLARGYAPLYLGGLLISVLAVLIGWRLLMLGSDAQRQSEQAPSAAPGPENSPGPATELEITEVFRFKQEYQTGPNSSGLRFHFTAREAGYLYIVAPVSGQSTVLLTNHPPVEMGVRTNRLKAGEDYAFPARDWLQLSEPTAKFEFIYSRRLLDGAAFLSSRKVRALTKEELAFLDRLRNGSPRSSQEEMRDGGVIKALPSANSSTVVAVTVDRKRK